LALRLVFMGTPDFAVPTLKKLVDSEHKVVAVYTRVPQPAGRRGLEVKASAVENEARRHALPIFTPKTLREQNAVTAMSEHGADAAVVVAYGLILPKQILEAFPLGCFNLHASLLPRWRGAAPIERAIMAGDRITGIKVMKMDEGLDTGLVAKGKLVGIDPNETAGDLHDELALLGADLMLRAVNALGRKRAWKFKPQSKRRLTYAHKIDKSETRIDWKKPWNKVHNHCRGLSPFPGAWFELPGLGRIKVLRTTKGAGDGQPGTVLDDKLTIACGKGAVRIVELQRAGGKAMSTEDFLRGTPVEPATVLH
jgi:methionyl-tRNA formyltransferase